MGAMPVGAKSGQTRRFGGTHVMKLMKRAGAIIGLGAAFLLSTAYAGAGEDAITQAEADLKAAQKAGAEWRVLDPATGGAAVPLSKLVKTAKAKLEGGDEAEAIRIAQKVSWASKTGIAQAQAQQGAAPYY